MNDIERLAAVIRDGKTAALQVPDSTLSGSEIDAKTPNNLSADIRSNIKARSEASNDTLLQDLESDFGLRTPEIVKSGTARQRSEERNNTITSARLAVVPTDDKRSSLSENSKSARTIKLPIEKMAAHGFITPSIKRGLLTEQFRRIKRPLLRNLDRNERTGESNNVIMVTSSVSGEGKTFTSINLAMSLAMEREKTVLLIDSDVLKNTASGILSVDRDTAGLTDLLVGDVSDPSDVILKTNIENFTYLPSGKTQHLTNELLSSDRMKQLFDELSNRYHDRIIVMDCPPLLQTNEATVLTDYAGQIVFVVAEEETSQGYVVEALNQIPKEKYVGVVLNKSRKRFLGNDYSYNYEYG